MNHTSKQYFHRVNVTE